MLEATEALPIQHFGDPTRLPPAWGHASDTLPLPRSQGCTPPCHQLHASAYEVTNCLQGLAALSAAQIYISAITWCLLAAHSCAAVINGSVSLRSTALRCHFSVPVSLQPRSWWCYYCGHICSCTEHGSLPLMTEGTTVVCISQKITGRLLISTPHQVLPL